MGPYQVHIDSWYTGVSDLTTKSLRMASITLPKVLQSSYAGTCSRGARGHAPQNGRAPGLCDQIGYSVAKFRCTHSLKQTEFMWEPMHQLLANHVRKATKHS